MKWNVFAVSMLVAWLFLFSFGAPPIPVFVGTAAMALWNRLKGNR